MAYSKFMAISELRSQLVAAHDISERYHEEKGGEEDEDCIEHHDLEQGSGVGSYPYSGEAEDHQEPSVGVVWWPLLRRHCTPDATAEGR